VTNRGHDVTRHSDRDGDGAAQHILETIAQFFPDDAAQSQPTAGAGT